MRSGADPAVWLRNNLVSLSPQIRLVLDPGSFDGCRCGRSEAISARVEILSVAMLPQKDTIFKWTRYEGEGRLTPDVKYSTLCAHLVKGGSTLDIHGTRSRITTAGIS